jgi:hypothetical protein
MNNWQQITALLLQGFYITVDCAAEHSDGTARDWDLFDYNSDQPTWFRFRVTVGLRGHILAKDHYGPVLYNNPMEALTDGLVDSMISDSLPWARREAYILKGLLEDLFAQYERTLV